MAHDHRSEALQIGLGLVALAVIGFLIYGGVTWVYRLVVPPSESAPASITMAAFFATPAPTEAEPAPQPRLRITGDVLDGGKPLAEGRAHVTVVRLNDASQQGVSVPVKDGAFATGDQAAFASYARRERLNILVEISATGRGVFASRETFLNSFPPVPRDTLQIMALVLLGIGVVFFWSFTGVATSGKNQAAIIFSYCVMLLFLALPFMAFYVLGRYQAVAQVAQDMANSTPVGVLPAVRLNDSDGRPATGQEREWVLNIGGIVVERPAPRPAPAAPVADAEPPVTVPAETPAAGASPPAAPATPVEPRADLPVEPGQEPHFAIEGGLVIPLYVIVLSIIGGAINMTRMLPVYQREATSLVSPRRWLSNVGGAMMTAIPGLPGAAAARAGAVQENAAAAGQEPTDTAAADSPTAPAADQKDGTNVTIVTAQPQHGEAAKVEVSVRQPEAETASDDAGGAEEPRPPANTTKVTVGPATTVLSPGELAAAWRQGLITQHMYLLSAPFLAVAMFYLLDWLDLRKKALLVLASFSVGLVSDKILSAVLSVVVPVLDRADGSHGTKVDVKSDNT